jgi:hypothetical protein
MTLFVIFIFGAVIIGAGAMLAPAFPTAQPRIGLSAAFSLALVIGGTLFWAALFGWNTLVVDYLMFALVTSIFLFGTLSYGQKRAEARGTVLLDADQGWTSGRDLLLFAAIALLFVLPAVILPVPLDTDAQGFGYLGLMAKLGGSFDTLAPFQPEITYLYSPGFTALIAYLSNQLTLPLHEIQFGVAAVLGLMNVWVMYDLGAELRDKRLGRAMALAAIGGMGLFLAFMDSHMTSLLALVFAGACITFMLRWLSHRRLFDLIAAGLMLGAVVISHPDTTIILGLGLVPWMFTLWLGMPRPSVRTWLALAVGTPIIAVAAILPWLVSILPLLGGDIVSPFSRDPGYALVMVLYHGVVIVPIAAIGLVIGLRRREQAALLAAGWLVLSLDFAAVGITESLLGGVLPALFRYDYPFSIAWHAPIIPYTILGGMGLLWLWDRFAESRFGESLHRAAPLLTSAVIAVLLVAGLLHQPILQFSKGRVGFFGAFSSAADVEAMRWLKANTPPDALILNHPGPHEADWVPIIAERRTVYFRPQPFFRGTEAVEALQAEMLSFWRDPSDPLNAERLRAVGVSHVIVPQVIADPASLEGMFRWRPPIADIVMPAVPVSSAPYLTLVFERDGAQVYRIDDPAAPAS